MEEEPRYRNSKQKQRHTHNNRSNKDSQAQSIGNKLTHQRNKPNQISNRTKERTDREHHQTVS